MQRRHENEKPKSPAAVPAAPIQTLRSFPTVGRWSLCLVCLPGRPNKAVWWGVCTWCFNQACAPLFLPYLNMKVSLQEMEWERNQGRRTRAKDVWEIPPPAQVLPLRHKLPCSNKRHSGSLADVHRQVDTHKPSHRLMGPAFAQIIICILLPLIILHFFSPSCCLVRPLGWKLLKPLSFDLSFTRCYSPTPSTLEVKADFTCAALSLSLLHFIVCFL